MNEKSWENGASIVLEFPLPPGSYSLVFIIVKKRERRIFFIDSQKCCLFWEIFKFAS